MVKLIKNIFKKFLSLVLGILIFILIAEGFLRLVGYGFMKNQSEINQNSVLRKSKYKPYKIAFFGESTTAVAANESNTVLVQKNAFPYFVQENLNQYSDKLNLDFVVLNKGLMGGTTAKIVEDFRRLLTEDKPDMAVFMMGMKDRISNKQKMGVFFNKLEDVLETFRFYNLVCLFYEQYVITTLNIDDSKIISKYEDLSKDFIIVGTKSVYTNVMKELSTININKEILQDLIKNFFLANYYSNTGQYLKSEEILKNTIEKNNLGYFLLVELYYKWNRFQDVEKILLEYSRKNPLNTYSTSELAIFYLNQKKLTDAKKVLDSLKPDTFKNSTNASIALAKYNLEKKNYEEVEKILDNKCKAGKKSLKETKFSDWVIKAGKKFETEECFYILAESYFYQKKYNQAEDILTEYLETGRKIYSGSELLRRVYEAKGDKVKAEMLLKETLKSNQRLGEYFALSDYYKKNLRLQEQKEVYEIAQRTFVNTLYNFKKIKELGDSYGVKIVFMQYPTFDLEFLKHFTDNLKGVSYIDNQYVFDDGPRIDYLFEARYPYNFNHYTLKGSKKIAENITNQLVKFIEEVK